MSRIVAEERLFYSLGTGGSSLGIHFPHNLKASERTVV